jgi:hypothetical protein
MTNQNTHIVSEQGHPKSKPYDEFLAEQLANDPELRAEYLQLKLDEQTALIIQMRDRLADIKAHEEKIIDDHIRIYMSGQPYEGQREKMLADRYYYGMVADIAELTPSQAETKLRNKIFQECIEVVKSRYGWFKSADERENLLEALQAIIVEDNLIKKEV